MTRQTVTHNLVLGTDPDNCGVIVVLEDAFRYGDGFIGCTGAEVRPVSEEEIKEAMREKREYLREMADDCDIHGAQRQELYAMPKDEYLELRFETYRDVSREDIAAALAVEVPERYTLTGCGRIFRQEMVERIQFVSDDVREEALAILREQGEIES